MKRLVIIITLLITLAFSSGRMIAQTLVVPQDTTVGQFGWIDISFGYTPTFFPITSATLAYAQSIAYRYSAGVGGSYDLNSMRAGNAAFLPYNYADGYFLGKCYWPNGPSGITSSNSCSPTSKAFVRPPTSVGGISTITPGTAATAAELNVTVGQEGLWPPGSLGHATLAYFYANHPDWIVYKCDRTTPALTYDYEGVLMDVSNPDVRDFLFANEVLPSATSGQTAIILDNAYLNNDFVPTYGANGVYTHYCGVYPNATPASPRGGGWQQKWAGIGSYANVNDPAFTDDAIEYFADFKARLHALNPPKRLLVNTYPMVIFLDPARRTSFMASIDDYMTQGGPYGPEFVGDVNRPIWLNNLKWIKDLQAQGGCSFEGLDYNQQPGVVTFESQIPDDWARYVYASYHLVKQQCASAQIFSQQDRQFADERNFWRSWNDTIQSGAGITNSVGGLGPPCEAYQAVAGTGIDSEYTLFKREYQRGIVLVNGAGPARAYSLPVQAGITYRDITNTVRSGSQTMAATTFNAQGRVATSEGSMFYFKTVANPATDSGLAICSGGAPPDTTPPVISAFTVGTITSSGGTVTFTTNENATKQIFIDTISPPAVSRLNDLVPATSHSYAQTGLLANTTYFVRVDVCDTSGNCISSGTINFTTSAAVGLTFTTTSPLPDCTVGGVCTTTFGASGGVTTGVNGWIELLPAQLFQPNSNLTNFPVTVCKTNPAFRSVANGGFSQDPQGDDIAPFADSGVVTMLAFDFESWNASTGEWCGFVRVPTLTSATPTTIYFAVGNATISSSLQDEAATWTGVYTSVYHGGNTAADMLGVNNGAFNGAVASVAGVINQAFELTAGGEVGIADNAAFTFGNGTTDTAFSWHGYVKFNEVASGTDAIFAHFQAPLREWQITKIGTTFFLILFDESADAQIARGVSGVFFTSYQLLGITYDGSSDGDGIKFYIDGTEVAQNANSDDGVYTAMEDTAANVEIGGRNGFASFRGALDEQRIVKGTVLSADWMAAVSENGDLDGSVTFGSPVALGGSGGLTFSLTTGSFCAGQTLTGAVLSGSPTTVETCNFDMAVVDSSANKATRSFTRTTIGAPTMITVIPNGVFGVNYQQSLISGGVTPFSSTVSSGALPNGIGLSSNSVTLNGAPIESGNFAFTISALDANSSPVSQAYTMSVSAIGGITIVTQALPDARVGVAYNATLLAQGGTPPYVWEVIDSVVPGLAVQDQPITAYVGIATVIGPYQVHFRVTDTTSPTPLTADITLPMNVNASSTLTTGINKPHKPSNCSNYSFGLRAEGGEPPYAWSLKSTSGPLPPGLSLSENSVVGFTTVKTGSYPVTFIITDANEDTAESGVITFMPIACSGGGLGGQQP